MNNVQNLDDISYSDFSSDVHDLNNTYNNKLNCDPEKLQNGLAKLVLTLIELLRRLMEKQAIRRIENGTVTDEEIEKLGEAFINLQIKMDELKETFELTDEDLNLDLGPLGKLM